MSRKKTLFRRITGWVLWLIVILFILFGLQITVLAFPQLIMSNSIRVGTVTLHYRGAPEDEMYELAGEADKRLQGSGFCDLSRTDPVFFFQNQKLYTLFARLAMVPPEAQGFELSIFGNSFVSGPNVSALADRSGGFPMYSIWEGSPAHTIAHEVGHQYMGERIGRGKWKQLPQWKQEGFAEYVANIALIREDSLATLANRVRVLENDRAWGWSRRWDRIHYEAGLLIEFLIDVKGYTLEEIVSDSVTREETFAAMLAWCQTEGKQP